MSRMSFSAPTRSRLGRAAQGRAGRRGGPAWPRRPGAGGRHQRPSRRHRHCQMGHTAARMAPTHAVPADAQPSTEVIKPHSQTEGRRVIRQDRRSTGFDHSSPDSPWRSNPQGKRSLQHAAGRQNATAPPKVTQLEAADPRRRNEARPRQPPCCWKVAKTARQLVVVLARAAS
jgi:hypothetical protein